MIYDYKTLAPAYGTAAPMWQMLKKMGADDKDTIAFGVAEMKFPLAPEIASAVSETALHGTFGYGGAPESMLEAVCGWFKSRHGFDIKPQELVQSYGVVNAVGGAIKVLTREGDGIIVMFPRYQPFENTVKANNRRLIVSDLKNDGSGYYTMDFDDIRKKAAEKDVTALILCNPHNPVGRVWTESELRELAEICLENGLYIISDEIHCDLIHKGFRHIPIASLSDDIAKITVTLTAPSKTFNIAGMTISNTIIKDGELRRKFSQVLSRDCGGYINVFGFAACEAAYTKGGAWLDGALQVIYENHLLIKKFMAENFPGAAVCPLEGTYLQWVDFSSLGLSDEKLLELLHKKAHFFTGAGTDYGTGYGQFARVNLACPSYYLEKALERLSAAF